MIAKHFSLRSHHHQDSCLDFLDGLEEYLRIPDAQGILQETLSIFSAGYDSLMGSMQTFTDRRLIFVKYQNVIHRTRKALNSASRSRAMMVTVYLLSLYEVCPLNAFRERLTMVIER